MVEKRRIMRRFFVAALVASHPAQAQQPIAAVQPVVDMLAADEAELAAALRSSDAARLQRLAWRNRQAAFALVKTDPPISPGDPVATALRDAHVACANAHSSVGMLASGAAQIVVTNSGGDNTRVDNDSNRNSFDFFLKPFRVQWRRCADRSGLALPASPLAAEASQLFPAFVHVSTRSLSTEDRAELLGQFTGLAKLERGLPAAMSGGDPEPARAALVSVMAFRRFLHVRDDPDMARRDFFVIKECRWAVSHISQLLGEVHEALIRPDIRDSQLGQARDTLGQYRATKADCAQALGLPREAGQVQGVTDTDFGN
jgi:hypothetical protein